MVWLSFLSGAVLILLLLYQGVRATVLYAGMAAAVVVGVGLAFGVPVATVAQQLLAIWIPALLLGTILLATRSLTLTLQLSYIIALAGMLVFFVVVGDVVEFWRELLIGVVAVWREAGLHEQADILTAERDVLAGQMTMIVAVSLWSLHAISCVLGNKLYRQVPGLKASYGRFRDLNFGRVIAWAMALVSVAALLIGASWLQNAAFMMFAMFWLQGLALVHWSHGHGYLPTFAVVATYVLAPVLNIILLMGLAISGYIDAWFGFRRLKKA
jgi:hypothetical protein